MKVVILEYILKRCLIRYIVTVMNCQKKYGEKIAEVLIDDKLIEIDRRNNVQID